MSKIFAKMHPVGVIEVRVDNHRYTLEPGSDVSNEPKEVKDLAENWTLDMVADRASHLQIQKNGK